MNDFLAWRLPTVFVFVLARLRTLSDFFRWLLGVRAVKGYLAWSLRQFYLLTFWPSQFHREFDDAYKGEDKSGYVMCLAYFLKMLPWIVGLAVLGNLLAGNAFQWLTDSPHRVPPYCRLLTR